MKLTMMERRDFIVQESIVMGTSPSWDVGEIMDMITPLRKERKQQLKLRGTLWNNIHVEAKLIRS